MRPEPSSRTAASGSTSRNSGLLEKRRTQSRLLSAIRFAISTRRAALQTRLMARVWLRFGRAERRSEMSSTAASPPRLSKIGAEVQLRVVWALPKWSS